MNKPHAYFARLGQSTSERKRDAARRNGRLGGRPRHFDSLEEAHAYADAHQRPVRARVQDVVVVLHPTPNGGTHGA